MVEFRLLPAAAVLWVALLAGRFGWVVAIVGALAVVRLRGQPVLVGGVAALGLCARRFFTAELPERYEATVIAVREHSLQVRHGGYPRPVNVFSSQDVEVGQRVLVDGNTVTVLGDPAGWVFYVRSTFADAVAQYIDGSHRGLIPGMVLGDTSLQDDVHKRIYAAAGLSHLSAVSGANVAIVTTLAVLACRRLGLRGQIAVAAVSLLVYVGLVGPEPSVLRAALTGLVGLLAVVSSSTMEPIHALCISIIAILLFQPDMATNVGFALSVAATTGIVALRDSLTLGLPPALNRAVAVAIAADVTTAPLIVALTGRLNPVSVLANVLVDAAAVPITAVGLVAAILSLLPSGLEAPLLWALAPLSWWIDAVARWVVSLPIQPIPADPLIVAVVYGWIVALALVGRPAWAGAALVVGACAVVRPLPAEVGEVPTFVVDKEEQVADAPAGTQRIVVMDPHGKPAERPVVTKDGVPVLYPARDGPVRVYVDGSQHAADGRF